MIDGTNKIDEKVRRALSRGHRVDITTTGRQSGQLRRIEVVFHNIDSRLYISGLPSRQRRSWLANLDADPAMTFHLKGPVRADCRLVPGSSSTRSSARRFSATLPRHGGAQTSRRWSAGARSSRSRSRGLGADPPARLGPGLRSGC